MVNSLFYYTVKKRINVPISKNKPKRWWLKPSDRFNELNYMVYEHVLQVIDIEMHFWIEKLSFLHYILLPRVSNSPGYLRYFTALHFPFFNMDNRHWFKESTNWMFENLKALELHDFQIERLSKEYMKTFYMHDSCSWINMFLLCQRNEIINCIGWYNHFTVNSHWNFGT